MWANKYMRNVLFGTMPSCHVGRACDRPLADLTGRRSRFSSISHLTSSAQVLKKRDTSVDDCSCFAPIIQTPKVTLHSRKTVKSLANGLICKVCYYNQPIIIENSDQGTGAKQVWSSRIILLRELKWLYLTWRLGLKKIRDKG